MTKNKKLLNILAFISHDKPTGTDKAPSTRLLQDAMDKKMSKTWGNRKLKFGKVLPEELTIAARETSGLFTVCEGSSPCSQELPAGPTPSRLNPYTP
jgi:hypothetical protein